MSKKFFILIAVVLVILLLSLVGYYFLISGTQSSGNTSPATTFKNFFPFGGGSSTSTTTDTTRPVTTENPAQNTGFGLKLRQISTEPVSGAGIFDTKLGTVVLDIEKATGHIFETELFSPQQYRISNTTIPLAYDALWSTASTSLIATYLKDDDTTIDTYTLGLKASNLGNDPLASTQYDTIGTPFPQNIFGIAVNGTNIFYLQNNGDSSTGFVIGFDGKNKKQIWQSPLKELNTQFVNTSTVALTTRPYPNVGGYLYTVNTSSGQVKKIMGNIAGLSTLVSPDGTTVLYLSQSTSGAALAVYTISSQKDTALTPATFPEKCIWSKKNSSIVYCAVPSEIIDGFSLTNWYMGSKQYSDNIWQYDLKTNTSIIIAKLSDEASGALIDVSKPLLSTNEQYLVFINKRDGTLWSLDLNK